jgi:hypothetical protein
MKPQDLNERSLSTILAALRFYQDEFQPDYRASNAQGAQHPIWEVATNCGTVKPLSSGEIDTLCEIINLS